MLDDIRVGDNVEYAYTRRGRNPIYNDKFHDVTVVRWNSPLHKIRISVFAAATRSIAAKLHGNASLTNEKFTHGPLVEQRWTGADIPAVEIDSQTPRWYAPYTFLQFSEYTDWADVVTWARDLYALPDPIPAPIAEKAAELTRLVNNQDGRALALISFVQDEIRYLGIELGPKSHKPSPPLEVLERRFGDCKDKSLLLCALLRQRGIRAEPALTSSYRGPVMPDWLPSPDLFDHVIARVQLGTEIYWADPTIPQQQGTLGVRSLPDYGYALPIAPGVNQLLPVPQTEKSRAGIRIEEHYDLSTFDRPAALEVRSHYSGSYADSMRSYLRQTSLEQVGKNLLNTRLRVHPRLSSSGAPTWTEDPNLNTVTVVHRYSLPDLWIKETGSSLWAAELYPSIMRDYTEPPDSPSRSMPLAITHPFRITHETFLKLPEAWPEKDDSQRFESSAFVAKTQRQTSGKTATLRYTWESIHDHVPADGVSSYVDTLRRFRETLGYQLSYDVDLAKREREVRVYWPLVLSLTATLLLCAGAIIWLHWRQYSSFEPPGHPEPRSHLRGLGGWLILVGLGIVLGPLRQIFDFPVETFRFFDARFAEVLVHPGSSSYIAGFAGYLIVETCLQVIFFVGSLWLITLFFSKNRLFPSAFITLRIFDPVASIALFLISNSVMPEDVEKPQAIAAILKSAVGSAIWIPYMLRSERVEATFTERMKKAAH
jgi:transglutaminase-like putative cysteine protease